MKSTIDIRNWIILDVCGTCYYMVGAGDEINDVTDARSAEALDVKWQDYELWVDCGGDGCDSEHRWICERDGCDPEFFSDHQFGHHAGGFTWTRCDVCGQGGRDSHRVIAEKLETPPKHLTVAVSHEITAGDMQEGDKLLVAEGIEGLPLLVESIDYAYSSRFAKLVDPERKELPYYHSFLRDDPVTVLFAASC